MAATIMAYYPNFWPETIRAIMVHSAEWTKAMRANSGGSARDEAKQILRCFGYGSPDISRALWSTRNALTLIIQEELQPYQKTKDGIKTKDFHIHKIPWPEAELASRNYIAIYPESGWWKDRPSLKRWNKKARYALIISIETPEVEVDIYTPVFNQIMVPITSS